MTISHRPRRSSPRHHGERGVALVEFALISVVLVLLLGAVFDYGLAWRTGLAVNEASRTGARVGSGQGNEKEADRNLLTGMVASLASADILDDVQQVVVFRSDSAAGTVPASCLAGTGGPCNVFSGNQFRAITDASPLNTRGCLTASTRRGWCPTDRVQVQVDAQYLGVWVRVRYKPFFPAVDDLDIERATVMRLEPED